jgi:hypothetical protein
MRRRACKYASFVSPIGAAEQAERARIPLQGTPWGVVAADARRIKGIRFGCFGDARSTAPDGSPGRLSRRRLGRRLGIDRLSRRLVVVFVVLVSVVVV